MFFSGTKVPETPAWGRLHSMSVRTIGVCFGKLPIAPRVKIWSTAICNINSDAQHDLTSWSCSIPEQTSYFLRAPIYNGTQYHILTVLTEGLYIDLE